MINYGFSILLFEIKTIVPCRICGHVLHVVEEYEERVSHPYDNNDVERAEANALDKARSIGEKGRICETCETCEAR